MEKKNLLSLLFVFSICASISGASVTFNGFGIVEHSTGPRIEVYKEHGPVPDTLYTLPIDGSLLSEYVFARLIHMRDENQMIDIDKSTSVPKYIFEYHELTTAGGNRINAENALVSIEFYETTDHDLKMKVKVSIGSLRECIYTLPHDANSIQKLKFDYIVSSLVDHYTYQTGSVILHSNNDIQFILNDL